MIGVQAKDSGKFFNGNIIRISRHKTKVASGRQKQLKCSVTIRSEAEIVLSGYKVNGGRR